MREDLKAKDKETILQDFDRAVQAHFQQVRDNIRAIGVEIGKEEERQRKKLLEKAFTAGAEWQRTLYATHNTRHPDFITWYLQLLANPQQKEQETTP